MKIIELASWVAPSSDHWSVEDNWHSRTARYLSSLFPEVLVESWSPARCDHAVSFAKDGVTYRVIPAETDGITGLSLSMGSLFDELDGDGTIVHLYEDSTRASFTLAQLLHRHRIPFVVQDLGSPIKLPNVFLQFISLRQAAHVFCVTRFKKEFFSEFGIPAEKMTAYELPSDLQVFRPRDKEDARSVLGLPKNAFLVFYAGRFNPYEKGLLYVLKACQALKNKLDVEPILVGGRADDVLYEYVKKRYRFVYPRLPHDERFARFYNACDVLVYFQLNQKYSGLNVSVLEAIGSEMPVVSNTLINYPGSLHRVGFMPRSPAEIEGFLNTIARGEFNASGRDEALKYGDYRSLVPLTKKIYDGVLGYASQS